MKNEEASDKYCQEELDRLSKDFMENISTFSVPGGHRLYVDMREKIERDYWQVPRKGVKVRSREHRNRVRVRSREHGNGVRVRSTEHGSLAQREGYAIEHRHTALLKRNKKTRG